MINYNIINNEGHKGNIYRIINPNNKIYIGQSTDIQNRQKTYQKLNCKGQIKLYNSLKKYGWENHKFEIIETCNIDVLDKQEEYWKQYYVDELGWDNMLFFMLNDGKGGNKSSATKIKMRISSTKIDKPINIYTLTGEFIIQASSPTEANYIMFPTLNDNTGGILASCRRNKSQYTHRNYIFQFVDDDKINEVLDKIKTNKKLNQKTIKQYTLNDVLIAEYKNSIEAEKALKEQGIKANSVDIRACCRGKQNTCKNFKWKYGEDYLDTLTYNHNINEIQRLHQQYMEHVKELQLIEISKVNHKKTFINFLQEYTKNIIINYNNEIDFYLPEYNIAINLIDLNNPSLDRKIYQNLFKKYNNQNIKPIQIYSDEWLNKTDIVKSRILNILKKTPIKIYARKCIIKTIESPTIKSKFLDQNHIQGADRSKIKYGLYHNNELVSVMTFNKPRTAIGKNNNIPYNSWELLRFSNKKYTNVTGAADKLLKHFIKNHHPSYIYSFADNRWSSPNSNLYLTLGFTFEKSSPHGYFYTKDHITRLHRFNFNKQRLKKLGADISKTEKQIMEEWGYTKIWDCGTTRYGLYLQY